MTVKDKRMYVQPHVEAVELQVMNQLLAGSTGSGSLSEMGGPENLAPEFNLVDDFSIEESGFSIEEDHFTFEEESFSF